MRRFTKMAKVSVIIPSRNEPNLVATVDDLFKKASGEIEVVVILDGPTSYPVPKERSSLVFISKTSPSGYRPNINEGMRRATGKYLMKIDAHVAMSAGFDEELQKNHLEDNWLSVPRRYDLDLATWTPKLDTKVDYYYFGCPWVSEPFMMRDIPWIRKDEERKDILIDDLMTFGGTCWFLTTDHFHNRLKGLSSEGYGNFIKEAQEVGLKTWLGGGRVIINKSVWCAHFGQPNHRHPFPISREDEEDHVRGSVYSAHHWTENRWEDRVHDFDWLVEKFWPLPRPGHRTNKERYPWPENWRDYYEGKIKLSV